ncbi:Phasin protein [Allopseudospirillum japonicum]|uniref:Phasin protein n=1 Tax=Allopseudospirillum japonicum TaxID=64971 RepID=A0A1H6QVI7_9GAMM|nr:phasin family protein [Allopseudospirillum japonicum]SEI47573.1 Phasin protein [Allopseudospirillum japonicum]
MFDKMFTDLQSSMKTFQPFQDLLNTNNKPLQPVAELMVLQARTIEKLITQQAHFYTECTEAMAQQVKTVAEMKDISSLQEAQYTFVQEMQERVGNLLKQNLDIMNEAKESATSELEAAKTRAQASKAS